MRPKLFFFAVTHLLACSVFAETPTADALMRSAQAQAAAERKAIYVHFGASWCGWCKRLDAFLDKPGIKPVFEKYFVPVKLVVSESDKNKALENSGADGLLSKVGGPSGLPYSAFLDSDGSLIVNSRLRGGENIGYPAQPQEIAWFVEMMKKAAPRITGEDLKLIESALQDEFKAIEKARNAQKKS